MAELEQQADALRERVAGLMTAIERELPAPSVADPHPAGWASQETLQDLLLQLSRLNLLQAIPLVVADADARRTSYYASLWSAYDELKGRHKSVKDIALDSSSDDEERFRRAEADRSGNTGKGRACVGRRLAGRKIGDLGIVLQKRNAPFAESSSMSRVA